MRTFIIIAAVLVTACGQQPPQTAEAQRPLTAGAYRVHDVPALQAGIGDGDYPLAKVRLGERWFFSLSTPQEGRELWVTDGTEAGTRLVIDLAPGPASSSPTELVVFGDGVAFSATIPGFTREIWFTDGTAAGTRLLTDVSSTRGDPTLLTAVGATLFFRAYTSTSGSELWKTDGNPGGTVLVKDIAPGSANASPDYLANLNGTLFFSAATSTSGRELWKTDGTAEGTVLVKDIVAGVGNSNPSYLYPWNGAVYFAANVGGSSSGLFRSDGTDSGTYRVGTGPSPAFPTRFTAAGGKLFFHAATESAVTGGTSWTYGLWVTDGTAEGTKLPRAIGTGNPNVDNFTPFNGFLYFMWHGAGAQNGLWRSDGTEAGTVWVSEGEDRLAAYAGGLIFSRYVTGQGEEPHFSNGTPDAPLVSLGNLMPDSQWSAFGSMDSAVMLPLSTQVVFFPASEFGVEPWVTDGTLAGTRLVKQLSRANESSDPQHLFTHGGSVYFSGGARRELWVSNGTAAGTQPIRAASGEWMLDTVGIGAAGNSVVAGTSPVSSTTGQTPTGAELYRIAGTQAQLITDLYAGEPGATPQNFLSSGTSAYFTARTGASGSWEPWITDGTPSGTVKLATLTSSSSQKFVAAAGYVGIDAYSGLLTTDGTPGGTSAVNVGGARVAQLTAVGDRLFFAGVTDPTGTELYVANQATGQLVHDAIPGMQGSAPHDLVDFGGTLVFGATHPSLGVELWKSDGTDAGTVVLDVRTGAPSLSPTRMVVHDGWVYFRGFSAEHGFELWRSDGTVENTQRVVDLAPGVISGLVDAPLVSIPGGPLLFVGSNITSGAELWQTQGTAGTTTLVADIAPGVRSASPSWLTRVGAEVFFAASDDSGDRELWATGVSPNPETTDGGTSGGGTDAGTPGGGGTDGGTPGGGGSDGGTSNGDGDGTADPEGCGCGATGSVPSLVVLALGVLLALRRRPVR